MTVAYAGDWPARLWSRVPSSASVSVVSYRLALSPGESRTGRLAFVSDLHIGPTTPETLLDEAFRLIRDFRPDVLLLGGDYVFLDATAARLDTLHRLVSSISCGVKLAVLGNHDLWTNDRAIARSLTDAGATVLVNESVVLPDPWSDVVVIGLDEPGTGDCDVAAALAQAGGPPVRIVLCHAPDGLQYLAGVDFDLYVCGHTHGGHLSTPWGPIVLPQGELCRRFPGGFARADGRDVFVSRGIGGTEFPMRTFAPPDVLLVEMSRG